MDKKNDNDFFNGVRHLFTCYYPQAKIKCA